MNTQPGKIQYAAACSHSAALLISSRHSMPLISSHSTSSPLPTGSALTLRFASSYNWDRGVSLSDGIEMGNTVSNQRSIDVNSRFNLEALYNKVPYLKKVKPPAFLLPIANPPHPKNKSPVARQGSTIACRHYSYHSTRYELPSSQSHRSHSGRTSLSRTL